MKIKKLLSLLLAVSMSIACVTGCGKEETSSTNQTTETTVSSSSETQVVEETPIYNVGSLPIVNEPITLKVLTVDQTDRAWDTADKSGFWPWLEEKTGIHFEVESYAKEELSSKLALIMATPDEMPDLFIHAGFSASDILSYGSNGQLLALEDYIDQYCPTIQKAFEETEGLRGGATAADGHIYSMPSVKYIASNTIYVLNSRFMENAGLDAEKDQPKTMEDLYEVFKVLQTADANGDGIVGNEICWSTTPAALKKTALAMVGISLYYPNEGCTFDAKNDKVFFVPTSEEYKYMLSMLAKMYKEGMIDQEIFTQTSEQQTAKKKDDLVFMSHTYYDPEKSNWNGISGAFFVDVPLTSAVNDQPTLPVSSLYDVDIAAVSAYTEYPEVCALLLDYFYQEECSKMSINGIEGVDYIVDEKGECVSASSEFKKGKGPNTFPVSSWNRSWFAEENTVLANDKRALLAEYGRMGFQNYLKFTDEQVDFLASSQADLGLYCDDYYVGVITGNYDLEKTWDEYVKKCEGMKVKEITDIYQDSYNTFYGLK